MLRRIIAALRNDRGEASAVSIILGTLLFVTASTGAVAVIGNVMASTAATRQNAIIEDALQDQIQTFQTTPWQKVKASVSAPTTSNATFNGVTFRMTSATVASSAPAAVTLRVAAPMVTAGSAAPADCSNAVVTQVAGCLSVSATRLPSVQEAALSAGVPGVVAGPVTVNSTQKALDFLTVTPAGVTFSDAMRVQAQWTDATVSPTALRYGFFCGADATPQATFTPTTMSYGGKTYLIMQLTPWSLRSVSGCTSATVGLWTSGGAATSSSLGAASYWRLLNVTGGAS